MTGSTQKSDATAGASEADAGAASTTSRGREGRDSQFGAYDFANDIGQAEAWTTNLKRLHDEFLDLSLVEARRSRAMQDKLDSLSIQAMQNAIESANIVSKNTIEAMNKDNLQATKHADLAADRIWNIDEQVQGVVDIETMRSIMQVLVTRGLAASAPDEK